MNKRPIQIKPLGIARNTKEASDGELFDMVNSRPRFDAWENMPEKLLDEEYLDLQTSGLEYSHYYHHPVLSDNIIIAWEQTLNTISKITLDNSGGSADTIYTLNTGETISWFAHHGNFLIARTSERILHFFYDSETTIFTEIKKIPDIQFKFSQYNEGVQGYTISPAGWSTATNEDERKRAAAGFLYEHLDNMRKIGMAEGWASARIAIKLTDGTYIHHTLPQLIRLGISGVEPRIEFNSSDQTILTNYYIGSPTVSLYIIREVYDIIKTYKDAGIFKSIGIFCSKIVSAYNINDTDKWSDVSGTPTQVWDLNYNEDSYKNILKNSDWYLIKEYEYNELEKELGIITDTIEITFHFDFNEIGTIETNTLLTLDELSHHELLPNKKLLFNSRFHQGDITVKVSKPLDNMWYPYRGYEYEGLLNEEALNYSTINTFYLDGWSASTRDWSGYEFTQVVEIQTDSGTVYNKETIKPMWLDVLTNSTYLWRYMIFQKTIDQTLTFALFLNPYISYPDYRAKKLSYFVSDGLNVQKLAEFTLESVIEANVAYYTITPDQYYQIKPIKITWSELTGQDAIPYSPFIQDTNRLQVSERVAPFINLAEHSYRIGNKEAVIDAIWPVQGALSEAQYGQFPLYVFTTKGMFTVEQGSGTTLYASVHPLNNEVLSPAKAVVAISGGLIFMTPTGIKMISGRSVVPISFQAEGKDLTAMQQIINDPLFISRYGSTEYDDMNITATPLDDLYSIESVSLAYNTQYDELIVLTSERFHWVYSFIFKKWFRATLGNGSFRAIVTTTYKKEYVDYDSITGITRIFFYDLNKDGATIYAPENKCFMMTRPLMFGTNMYKTIDLLKIHLNASAPENKFNTCILYGSNSIKDFTPIAAFDNWGDMDHFIFKRIPGTYKYFILVAGWERNGFLSAFDGLVIDKHVKD